MEIIVQGFNKTDKSLISRLSVDGSFYCFTLENAEHLIATGRYPIDIRPSPHFKMAPMPHIEPVPGRSELMIHPANWPSQLQGCVAPGETYGQDCVNSSLAAFNPLFAHIKGAIETNEPVWITFTPDFRPTA